ncbi:GIY-YIG nuclease family protein [Nocardia aurantia]|uniref:GIY-YIG domain-containing protein n=1 Tax=Nocardia aurantia TaxID=2585199 RepID=A0A7K0DR38_9NOCA|nr:GIY-YIG nuclease family protein [Nocardia aurantia]MQY27997.1 hypothetical protein [Nocardia aurantia]
MSSGKLVRLFLVDGTPGGLLTAEVGNWTGHVVAAPRSDLPALLGRDEVKRTGIYILLGEDPETGGALAYIGEGDEVRNRLQQHAKPETVGGKDFWDRAVVVTSTDTHLTKSHARYLESRFIRLALAAGRTSLTNGTTPPLPRLSEADTAVIEAFILEVLILLPVLGINIFRSVSSRVSGSVPVGPEFLLRMPKYDVVARAREVDGEFTVLEGSSARQSWTGADNGYGRLRRRLEEEGVLRQRGDGTTVFTRDYPFPSPSAAAAVVAGRNMNGRTEWRFGLITLGEWQNREVATEVGES